MISALPTYRVATRRYYTYVCMWVEKSDKEELSMGYYSIGGESGSNDIYYLKISPKAKGNKTK